MKKNQAKKREAGREVPAEGAIVLSRLSVAQVNEIKNKVIQRSKRKYDNRVNYQNRSYYQQSGNVPPHLLPSYYSNSGQTYVAGYQNENFPYKRPRSPNSCTPRRKDKDGSKFADLPKEIVLNSTYEEYLAATQALKQQQMYTMQSASFGVYDQYYSNVPYSYGMNQQMVMNQQFTAYNQNEFRNSANPSKYDQDVEEFLRKTSAPVASEKKEMPEEELKKKEKKKESRRRRSRSKSRDKSYRRKKMTVCKFYMQGKCRYGSNCNFEHPGDQRNYQDQNRDFRYQTYQPRPPTHSQNFPKQDHRPTSKDIQTPENINATTFLELIRTDMSNWINSSAWKLSCYAYSRCAPCISVLHDISAEEVRYSLYEARAKNNLPQAINEYNNKVNENLNIIKQMINPNQQTREYLLNYFHESEKLSSESSEENPFMKIVQQKQIQPEPQNQFAQLVSQQTKPQFGTGFGTTFAKAPDPSPAFNLATPREAFQASNSKPMETNFFSSIVQMNTAAAHSKENTFFGQKLPLTKEEPQGNNFYYSQMNEINKQHLNEFKSNEFTIGRIPNVPPPKELC
ncbi:nucleoporin 2 [Brachionus plicatilis]|uniref:Nucleoporin NUP42 n=1 Tax=Brachionus plicatilis TaxID=10195 RepID=A0A3M7S6L3_BRAPC|nr:nucleoporin 2 [Brachionus plicatilis]